MGSLTVQKKLISALHQTSKIRLLGCIAIAFPLTWLSQQILAQREFAFDTQFLQFLQQSVAAPLGKLLTFAFHAGDTEVSGTLVAAVLALLVWSRWWSEAVSFAIASAGVLGWVDLVLKPFFDRPRPPFFNDPSIDGEAFPSGHATGNLMLYLFLAYLLSARFPKFTAHFYTLAISMIGIMGLGSIYRGVHWPTDVLGGYGFGFIWLTVCLIFLKALPPTRQRRVGEKSRTDQ